MRNPSSSSNNSLTIGKAGALSASVLAMAAVLMASPATAQSRGSFDLPPTAPTPSPAPQGPEDVRSGVRIGPRTIPTATPAPSPTPTPLPTASSPAPPPAPTATSTPTQSTQPVTSDRPSATNTATASSVPAAPAPDSDLPVEDATPDAEQTAAPGFTPDAGGIAPPSAGSDLDEAPVNAFSQSDDKPLWPWIAGLTGLLGLICGAVWWNRRRGAATKTLPPPEPAASARANTAAPAASAAVVAPRVDVTVDIVGGSRSVMMFTLDFRVNFANRSDRAVRDLSVAAQLTCAERGSANAAPVGAGQPIETVERIGPHQSRSITGQIQLPLAQVRAIMHGQKPLFIPLLHLTIEGAGQTASTRSYVVGLPSAAVQGRLQPIPLDTPPGGIPGLGAREIKL